MELCLEPPLLFLRGHIEESISTKENIINDETELIYSWWNAENNTLPALGYIRKLEHILGDDCFACQNDDDDAASNRPLSLVTSSFLQNGYAWHVW